MMLSQRFMFLVVTIFVSAMCGCGKQETTPVGKWKDLLGSRPTSDGRQKFEILTTYEIGSDSAVITRKCFASSAETSTSIAVKILVDNHNGKINFIEERSNSSVLKLDNDSVPCTVSSPPSGWASYKIANDNLVLTVSTGAQRSLQRYQN